MKRLTAVLLLTVVFAGCKDEPKKDANAEAPTWSAEVVELDTTTSSNIEVKVPGSDDFAPWRGGQPIPPKSTVRTPKTVRATLSVPQQGKLTLNHSTTVQLAEAARLELTSGQAVLEYPPDKAEGHEEVTVVLPAGHVVLHGTKVALVAGEKESTVTVTQGLVEVQHAAESFEARAGQELVLRPGKEPTVSMAPDLGRRVGWSQIGETEFSEVLPEVPRGLGKLVGKTPGGETEHRLDLVDHQVDVKIQGNLAYTEITESFKNPVGQTLEGVYRFPLPSDGRISRLALKVGNKWMEGEFLETARAEQIWRDVIHKWRDPAMLKWKEGNTFELRIFPIEPHQTRKVTIGYVQRLEPSVGGYTYTYPMPMDRAGLIPADKFTFNGEVYGHDATQELEMLGYAGTVEKSATDDDRAFAKVSFTEDNFVARGDLSVRFGRRDARGMRTYAYANPKKKDEDPYAVFVVRPDLPARTQIKPRDFVVVVDASLSRTGAALEVQRRLVPRMIREMDPLDRVAVVACAERCTDIAPNFTNARASLADEVAMKLLDLDAGGATYPVEAIRVAAELFRKREKADEREAHVVYFTDGIASIGELRPGKLSDAVGRTLSPFDARMSIVNVGGNSDDLVLDALARAGRGRVVSLDPMLSMTGQALDILSSHYRDVLERPKLTLPDGVRAQPALPTALASGDEIVVAARFAGNITGELLLEGKMNGEDYTLRYPVDLKPQTQKGNQFVPGEWAAQRIDALQLDAGDHEDEIVKLSKRYGVLSRYTTLLALESKEMMNEYGVREQERTQWTGDEMAEGADEEASAGPAERPKPRPKPRRSSRSKKKALIPTLSGGSGKGIGSSADGNKSAPRKSKHKERIAPAPKADMAEAESVDMLLDAFGDDSPANKPADIRLERPRQRPISRPVKRRRRYRAPQVYIREARGESPYERRDVEEKKRALQKDPTNRTKRMRLIRSMVRAHQLSGARSQTRDWLDTNPMDPEAIVQFAQLEAQEGRVDEFYSKLISAADAAPRGRWLQERIARAAEAQGDEAMACAMNIALEATAKNPPNKAGDILACPMTTTVGTWFGEKGPAPVAGPPEDINLKGRVVVKLNSSGGDWDIVLLEPSGRPLWWGSSRQNIKVANVRGTDRTEVLALPRLRRGAYSVRAVPVTGKTDDPLKVEVISGGQHRTFSVKAPSKSVFEVAEFEYR